MSDQQPYDELSAVIARLTEIVESVRPYMDLPCVCDESSIRAKEESLARCARCHIESAFDETVGQAEGEAEYLHRLASNHPKKAPHVSTVRKDNIVRFHPAAKTPQPNGVWKG